MTTLSRLLACGALLAAASACASAPAAPSPTAPPPTAPPTEAPPPNAEPGSNNGSDITGLREQLSYTTDEGGPYSDCAVLDVPSAIPAISALSAEGAIVTLCLWGFPLDQGVALQLYYPNGDLAAATSMWVEDDTVLTQNWFGEAAALGRAETLNSGLTVWSVELWTPAGVTTGTWAALGRAGDLHAEGSFDVPAPSASPAVFAVPEDIINYLGGDAQPQDGQHCEIFHADQTATVYGGPFAPGQSYPLGIYSQSDSGSETLVFSFMVETDATGWFTTGVTFTADDPPGLYHAILVTDGDAQDASEAGPLTCFEIR